MTINALRIATFSFMLFCMPAIAQQGAHRLASAPDQAAVRDGSHDFDFLHGKWRMPNHRLIKRLAGSHSWDDFISCDEDGPMAGELGNMDEQHWYPPTVFSFYRPGDKETLLTNSLLLNRWGTGANFSNELRTTSLCTTCDTNLDFTNLTALAGGNDAGSASRYLLDALVDGGTPQLQALLQNYLANNIHNINGAVWMVLTSPEFEVN